MTGVTVGTAAGRTDVIGLVPGEPIEQTLTVAWRSHVPAHLERCGAVAGPLADWVCRQGHPLYQ